MARELAGHGYQISPGTLYPTLHRLETDGLLVSEQRVVEGRTRRVYRATDAGKAALAEDPAGTGRAGPGGSARGGPPPPVAWRPGSADRGVRRGSRDSGRAGQACIE
ncbi:PadR family transcriptional regulator [Streptomyces erythrochromogenes]|uniref:PadR family transcriptional regulator n=1 Tax=Streptomyces erythrochromogenes TaxID=285574 RepID=UPI00225A8465|nr:PadR family transcriptional regulator [Streptomyces erythrochromogenes]MCX5582826.1 PadR family transcriptional regulator [Streptomyces erythrochromogenes]